MRKPAEGRGHIWQQQEAADKITTVLEKVFLLFDFLNNILLACNLPLTTEEVKVQKLRQKRGFRNVSYSPAQLVISIKYAAAGVLCL